MKTKFYELIIPKDVKIPTITRTFTNHVFEKITCDLPDKWAIDYFSDNCGDGDINDYFCCKGLDSTSFVKQMDKFENINDNFIELKHRLLKISLDKEVVVAHRKHPAKENIRQIALIKGKTDHPIHWID